MLANGTGEVNRRGLVRWLTGGARIDEDRADADPDRVPPALSTPDEVEKLRVAGRAGVDSGAPDAVDQLRRVTELAPGEAESWRDLGDALATEGRTEEAAEAFRKALEIDPDDQAALTAVGHSEFQGGEQEAGVELLARVAGRDSGMSTALLSLVDMYRTLGKIEEALAAAERVAEADPADPLAALDPAELNLQLERHDDAAAAFERLRGIVELPEHQVAALHGLVKVELARGDLERALEYAREARAIDTVGRTRGVLAHLEAETGGDEALAELGRDASAAMLAAIEAPPSRAEVETALGETLSDVRGEWSQGVRVGGPLG